MTAVKTLIKPNWTIEKLQEVTSHVIINNVMIINKLMEKLTPELRQEFHLMMLNMKVDYFRSLNIKTPMDLAIGIAEYDTNVWGSKVHLEGEPNKVTVEIETCGCWNLIQKHPCFTPNLGINRGECHKKVLGIITEELGFKGNIEITDEHIIIHITK